jgi:hypothetical protein
MSKAFKLFEEEQDPEIVKRNEATRDWKKKRSDNAKKNYFRENQSLSGNSLVSNSNIQDIEREILSAQNK